MNRLVWVCRARGQTLLGRPSLMHPNNLCGSSISDARKRAQRLAKSPRRPASRDPSLQAVVPRLTLGLPDSWAQECVWHRLLAGGMGFASTHLVGLFDGTNTGNDPRSSACQARDGTFPSSFATGVSTLRPFLTLPRTSPTVDLPLGGRRATTVNGEQQLAASPVAALHGSG